MQTVKCPILNTLIDLIHSNLYIYIYMEIRNKKK